MSKFFEGKKLKKILFIALPLIWLVCSGFVAFIILMFAGGGILRSFEANNLGVLGLWFAANFLVDFLIVLIVLGPFLLSLSFVLGRKGLILGFGVLLILLITYIVYPRPYLSIYSFPKYPGAKELRYESRPGSEGLRIKIAIEFSTPNSTQQVFDFYQKKFSNKGFYLVPEEYLTPYGQEQTRRGYYYLELKCHGTIAGYLSIAPSNVGTEITLESSENFSSCQ